MVIPDIYIQKKKSLPQQISNRGAGVLVGHLRDKRRRQRHQHPAEHVAVAENVHNRSRQKRLQKGVRTRLLVGLGLPKTQRRKREGGKASGKSYEKYVAKKHTGAHDATSRNISRRRRVKVKPIARSFKKKIPGTRNLTGKIGIKTAGREGEGVYSSHAWSSSYTPFCSFLPLFVLQSFLVLFFRCTYVPRLCSWCYLVASDTGSYTTGRYSIAPFAY